MRFSTDFSSGSIGEVKALETKYITDNESDSVLHFAITTKVDPQNPRYPNYPTSNRWFYFLMSGVKGQTVALDITYNDSRRAMYSYDNINFSRFTTDESPLPNGTITKQYERDSVYIAYFTPYTLKDHQHDIDRWRTSPNVNYCSIGYTRNNRPLDMLVITDNFHDGLIPDQSGELNFKLEDRQKKIIYIHGRIHPSESPSSFHLKATIDQLLDDSTLSRELLHKTIFYIIPFTNPDGVDRGYSRSNSEGVNLEVNYDEPEGSTACEVAAIKQFLLAIKRANRAPDLILNMHSQSTPKTTYWVHNATSTTPRYNRELMLLSALTADKNPYFKWTDISYSTLKQYYIEGWARELFEGNTIAQTFETPYSYYSNDKNGEWVTIENLESQAQNTINAISDLLHISHSARAQFSEPVNSTGFRRKRDNNHIYFNESYLVARQKGGILKYDISQLHEGSYAVYRWSVGKNTATIEHDSNSWEFVELYDKKRATRNYYISAQHKGAKFDKILFIQEIQQQKNNNR